MGSKPPPFNTQIRKIYACFSAHIFLNTLSVFYTQQFFRVRQIGLHKKHAKKCWYRPKVSPTHSFSLSVYTSSGKRIKGHKGDWHYYDIFATLKHLVVVGIADSPCPPLVVNFDDTKWFHQSPFTHFVRENTFGVPCPIQLNQFKYFFGIFSTN